MAAATKHGGRPRGRKPKAGERVHLGIRVTPEMKSRIEQAAATSGRSQSQEAEFRLERSLEQEGSLPELLELTFGRQLAGILMFVGAAMKTEGQHAAKYPFGEQWLSEPRAFEQAVKTANELLLRMAPPSDPQLATAGPEELTQGEQQLLKYAQEQRDVADKEREEERLARVEQAVQIVSSGDESKWPQASTARAFLGPIAKRLSKEPRS
ncbi:TraY domain-containing protein [Methyloceanibacter sp.]|uniref:TraY domain-containing protein n=1 Tax=Methyloceanibacter sp. TaxID=1965321 RepID=UPI002B5C3739|nr:TraY domain-containing protein [Methyloceanibacter sp.]HML93253.1 TraY domain-containing protein [Methyloceanibacter sp.]